MSRENISRKILVCGSSGFLGSSLLKDLNKSGIDAVGVNSSQLNLALSVGDQVQRIFKENHFTHIAICSAISDVKTCFNNQKLSRRVNVEGTIELLQECKKIGAIPIFFSSDYVFGAGAGFSSEDSARNPETVYGKQKLEVENYIETYFAQFLIFRTSKLMSLEPHPRSILFTIIREVAAGRKIQCFEDQCLNPVFVEDISHVLKILVQEKIYGTFHLGTKKVCSRFDLARKLITSLKLDADLIKPAKMSELIFQELIPTNNTLNCELVGKRLGFRFRETEDVTEVLASYLRAGV